MIVKLAQELRDGLSSVDLTLRYVEKIKRSDLNAFVRTSFDEALRQAEYADSLLREGKGTLLTGIPMSLKDNLSTKGIETTCCSKMLTGYKPFYNATAYEKLLAQGAVLLGKTNMDEFAMGSTSETSCFGAPYNPHDRARVTGGSSGGSAAAVADGLSVYSLGSDTGGSVRQPSAFFGVVGLKPTYGAVSRYGLIAYASSFDQIGPICSCVEDASIVFDAIKGKDEKDQTSVDTPDRTVNSLRNGAKMRIGVVRELSECSDDVKKQMERAICVYREQGARIVECSMPDLFCMLSAYYIIACAEASSNLGRYDGIRFGYRAEHCASVEEMMVKSRTEGFGEEVKRRIMLGTFVLSEGYADAYYKRACMVRNQVCSAFDSLFSLCDVILAPTAPTTAFPLKETRSATELYRADAFTVPANLAGLPAVSVPFGTDANGLPVGLQLIGKKFDEGRILSAAYALEQGDGV